MTKIQRAAVVEYAHVYLGDDISNRRVSNSDVVTDVVDFLTTNGFDVEILVVVDDTTTVPQAFGSEAFYEYRDAFTTQYLERLPIEPDHVRFESAFEPTIEMLIRRLPRITNGDLSDDSAWGYRESNTKAYVYGPGPNRTKVKVRDESEDSSKSRPYTCAMYDTAITVSKLTALGGLSLCPTATLAVTIHDPRYLESTALTDSAALQAVLTTNGIVEWPDAAHYEIGETSHAVDELMSQRLPV